MDNRELHVPIDIQKLADSLRGKFETLYPISQDCCIYRVPQEIRLLNPSAYTPQVVSIGPLHHGKKELKAMEENKIRYFQHFVLQTKVRIEDFLASIKDKEAKLRNCYAEIIELKSDDFVMMILVDAVFLIEYFLRRSDREWVTNDDRIFRKPWIEIWYDLWLLENQLPFFILNDLFILAKISTDNEQFKRLDLMKLIIDEIKGYTLHQEFLIEENLLECQFAEAEHFLDWLRRCLHQNSLARVQKKVIPGNIPTLTELHQAGVKFTLRSSKNLFDITFNKGILEIPYLTIYISTESLFRNLQAFERLHCDSDGQYINNYVIIMNHLVNTTKDVELLVQNGVIENWLWDSEAVSTLFHNLVKETSLDVDNFYYGALIEDLKTYCRFPWNRWKATLKQNYFNSPWASVSVVAAVVLLLLAFIQTVCSIIEL